MDTDHKEILEKEIDVLQGIIKRMADNSFNVKKWTVILVGVIMMLKQNIVSPMYGIIPLVSFWVMDSKYLQLERMFVQLQNDKVKERIKNRNIGMYEFNPNSASKKDDFFAVMFSWSQSWLYLTLIGLLFISTR
jgi:hypothetical protein